MYLDWIISFPLAKNQGVGPNNALAYEDKALFFLLQATASRFIDRLSEEYESYVDVIQPIQVAVYEMKFGLALLMSNTLQKDFLGRVQENTLDPILVLDASLLFHVLHYYIFASVWSHMEFCTGCNLFVHEISSWISFCETSPG